jgi:transposase
MYINYGVLSTKHFGDRFEICPLIPGSWVGAMEATMFTGWIYDFLKPYAVELKVAHPAMLKAITAAKKKSDRTDAEKLADLLRVNLLPECTMMSEELRELRRILRYRNMVVRTSSKMKNKISGLLMEVGATYDKRKLHGKRYSANCWSVWKMCRNRSRICLN